MSVCCECCVLSGRGLCAGLITHPGSPTECSVSECDHESSTMRIAWPHWGLLRPGKNKVSVAFYRCYM